MFLAENTWLRYFAVDAWGNSSDVGEEHYRIYPAHSSDPPPIPPRNPCRAGQREIALQADWSYHEGAP
jgi:hypothetical protein